MNKKIALFVDTSISHSEVNSISPVDVHILGSAKKGSILDCVINKYTHICLIDGGFDWTPAVWHKEILIALEHGLHIIGGVSIGALRAVELKKFGMMGYGKIFNLYDKGVVTGDDEIAVVSTESECTVPLINIRCSIDNMSIQDDKEQIFNKSKDIFYKERTVERLRSELGSTLFDKLKACYIDIKNNDARVIISCLDEIFFCKFQYREDLRSHTSFEKKLIYSRVDIKDCIYISENDKASFSWRIYTRAKNLLRLCEKKYSRQSFIRYVYIINKIDDLNIVLKDEYLIAGIHDFRRTMKLNKSGSFKKWLVSRYIIKKNIQRIFSDYILMLKVIDPKLGRKCHIAG